MSDMAGKFLPATGSSVDWFERLELYDPRGELNTLLLGLDELLEPHYPAIVDEQTEMCRRDPILGSVFTEEVFEKSRAGGIEHMRVRFIPPQREDAGKYKYTTNFAKLMVDTGVPFTTAMAIVYPAYDRPLKIVLEKLEGQRLKNAVRAISILKSVEADIVVSTMNRAMRERHITALQEQAHTFEENVLGAVHMLAERSNSLRQSSANAAGASKKLLEASSSVATAADQSATAMEEAGKSVEFLDSTVNTVRESTRHAGEATADASNKAAASAASAQQLSTSNSKIDAVVKLIQSIAEQTQMLALNASIEAARAGESGVGFAVVAGEVKELSNATRKATAEIATQIDEMVAATDESATAATEISGYIQTIETSVSGVQREVDNQLHLIQSITDAVSETFMSADNVTQNVNSIANVAHEVAERSVAVAAEIQSVDDLLASLERDMRSYRMSFDRLIAS